MSEYSTIVLKRGRDASLKRFHPWVFSGAVHRVNGTPGEGDIVDVLSYDGEFLGRGHYQIGSITVRILTFTRREIDCSYWVEMLQAAADARKELPFFLSEKQTNAYRLVHGEGDNLPGLIVDIYNRTAVVQAHSAGMFLQREEICNALKTVLDDSIDSIYDKSEATAPFKANLPLKDGYLWRRTKGGQESDNSCVVKENGNSFIVNWVEGQKTGFFLDQRDNRALVGLFANGRRVLNLFCYTGGFSIYALAGGAESVDSVDSSAKAIELVNRNVELNFGAEGSARHRSFSEDAIEFVKRAPEGKYDMMIVDPPAFAKHRGALDNALRAYKRLNAAAISRIARGGIVFTFSCSQAVDKEAFALAVFSAAAISGRKVRILGRLTQPMDHPVNIYHPEGEYLKGLVLYVE